MGRRPGPSLIVIGTTPNAVAQAIAEKRMHPALLGSFMRIAHALETSGPLGVTDLSRKTGLHRRSLTATLPMLADRGYLQMRQGDRTWNFPA